MSRKKIKERKTPCGDINAYIYIYMHILLDSTDKHQLENFHIERCRQTQFCEAFDLFHFYIHTHAHTHLRVYQSLFMWYE